MEQIITGIHYFGAFTLYAILVAIIDHWVGGAALFRGKKSLENHANGIQSAIWDRRFVPFTLFLLITLVASYSLIGNGIVAPVAAASITLAYIFFRQRSHNPSFYALHGNPAVSKGNAVVNFVVGIFTGNHPEYAQGMTEKERVQFGTVWGRYYGVIGLLPSAILLAAFTTPYAVALCALGFLFGDIQKQLGVFGKLHINAEFMRSHAELAIGGLIVAPFSLASLALIAYYF